MSSNEASRIGPLRTARNNQGHLAADKEMTMTIAKIIFSVAASAAVLISAVPAAAQEMESAAVYVGDLDFSSAEDAKLLDRRIARAANRICGAPYPTDIHAKSLARTCREQVRASAAEKRAELAGSKVRYAEVTARSGS
jgi:UrcA family protein